MSLDRYLVRCQRNALWAALPLVLLTAFVTAMTTSVRDFDDKLGLFGAWAPLACVLAALTFRLAAGAADLLQRLVAAAAAVAAMSAFVAAPLYESRGGAVVLLPLVLVGVVLAGWSLAGALVPARTTASGRLAWWRIALIVLFVGVLPASVEIAGGSTPRCAGASVVLIVFGPAAFSLACARSGPPMRMIVVAECLGGAVGAWIDSRYGPASGPLAAVQFALIYALAAASAYVASRARCITAVRSLDGVPVRLQSFLGDRSDSVEGAIGTGAVFLGLLLAVGCWLVQQTESHARSNVVRLQGPVDSVGFPLEHFTAMFGGTRPAAGSAGAASLAAPDANAGIEGVLAALQAGRCTPGVRVGDTDRDGRSEYLDTWGNPLVYFDSADYAAAADGVVCVRGDGVKVTVVPVRDPATGGFSRPTSFQLFSIGPDQLPNTEDDIEFDP